MVYDPDDQLFGVETGDEISSGESIKTCEVVNNAEDSWKVIVPGNELTVVQPNNNYCTGATNYGLKKEWLSFEIIMSVEIYSIDVFAGDDLMICGGEDVFLTGEGAGPGGTYEWDLGVTDGLVFTPAATETYTLTGTDDSGCSATDEVTVTVVVPDIDAGPDIFVCEGESVILSGSGAGLGGIYDWDGGVVDGLAFTPATTTTYTVTGTDANGCVNTDDVTVAVAPLPLVDAGPDISVCDGDDVILAGSGAVTYLWDGGVVDGLAYTPATTTTYTVTGTDASGCVNTDDVTVTVNPLPLVDAGPDISVCEGDDVILAGSGAVTYLWDGGVTDGLAFTPVTTGTYTVTGTDANGCVNTDEVTISLSPLPEVIFTADILSGCSPLKITFSALTAGENYEWIFGDGAEVSVTETSVIHLYEKPGLFDVTLLVISDEGCENHVTYTDFIDAVPSPIADFYWESEQITVIKPEVQLINMSTNADHYQWSFGDGNISELENPNHVYPFEGGLDYCVQLNAYNDAGCKDSVIKCLNVEDRLVYFMPNSFTPDGDNKNATFMPIFFSGLNIYNYHLTIFNRWGEIVFESYNLGVGWDGTQGKRGFVKDDVYMANGV
ncbi:MAG: PKD domain-containing protein [Crocinitomicaceae bacterium]